MSTDPVAEAYKAADRAWTVASAAETRARTAHDAVGWVPPRSHAHTRALIAAADADAACGAARRQAAQAYSRALALGPRPPLRMPDPT